MKAVSTVIATLLLLIITIALAGIAFSYITSVVSTQKGVVLQIDSQNTTCVATTDVITLSVKNLGDTPIDLNTLTISGTTSAGASIAATACRGTAGVNLNAGGEAACPQTVTGSTGFNTIRVSSGASTATATVSCA